MVKFAHHVRRGIYWRIVSYRILFWPIMWGFWEGDTPSPAGDRQSLLLPDSQASPGTDSTSHYSPFTLLSDKGPFDSRGLAEKEFEFPWSTNPHHGWLLPQSSESVIQPQGWQSYINKDTSPLYCIPHAFVLQSLLLSSLSAILFLGRGVFFNTCKVLRFKVPNLWWTYGALSPLVLSNLQWSKMGSHLNFLSFSSH